VSRLNLGSGIYVIEGFHNRDPDLDGWRFEHGLPEYEDGSVEAITVSHALMYVALADWPAVFQEFARVLEPGGVVRITEDATDDRASERFGGWPGYVTLTSSDLVADHIERAGLRAYVCSERETMFADRTLIQRLHGPAPKVFHVEGVKL